MKWINVSGGYGSKDGPACDLCTSCELFSYNKNSSFPYKCSCNSTACAAHDRVINKTPNGCQKYKPR